MDLTITVTTGDGRTATTGVELPDPAAPGLQVGLSTAVENYPTWHPRFPGFAGARLFWQPGDGLPDWNSPKLIRLPPGAEPWLSFKDFPTDAQFKGWLRAATRPVKVSWWHERDNNTPQTHVARMDFFARQQHLADIVAAVANPLVEWMSPPQTLQWTVARSSLAKVKGDGDWRLWWPGSGAGSCWDCYADSWADSYPDPVGFFRIPVEAAAGTGRPLYIAELGAVRMPSDPTGASRAAWIRDCVAYLREVGASYVAWWCEIGTGGRDFQLTDRPSADAWRAAIADQTAVFTVNGAA